MLTPRFKLSQDENHVFITLHAPYTNVGETEIHVDGQNFLFVSAPYFLRLRLPGKIVENDEAKGKYDCDSGDFNLQFVKETPGEKFENLDMITSLLAPRGIPDVNPSLVQELEETGISIEDDEEEIPEDRFTYGFASKISKDFCDIGKEFPQIFELRAPERVAVDTRHHLRTQYENHKFSSDHYIADYFDEELLEPYLKAVAPWNAPDFKADSDFTEDEIGILKELPNKHYILTKKEHREVMLSLVDILFASCYDKRTTLNDASVESSWTINKVSPTLTWFCTFNDMKEVLIACYRRAISFPIYRNFELCNRVKDDLASLLSKGKKFVIKNVIEIYNLFNLSNDARYILNQLYIKDYLIFLQKCKEEDFQNLAKSISETEVQKEDLGLDIHLIEAAAEMVHRKEEGEILVNEAALKMANMSLIPGLDTQHNNLNELEDDEDGWVTTSASSDSSSDDSSDESSSSEELDSDDDPS
ncbi:protein SHQ1 homolog [Epargyreus clarus]|uniref:protein SHQ1 homolog n=1 Tax=Epargyreus clarus TaxID=520877 RepID=UPI003C2B1CC9